MISQGDKPADPPLPQATKVEPFINRARQQPEVFSDLRSPG
jgi:hypothetical protein